MLVRDNHTNRLAGLNATVVVPIETDPRAVTSSRIREAVLIGVAVSLGTNLVLRLVDRFFDFRSGGGR